MQSWNSCPADTYGELLVFLLLGSVNAAAITCPTDAVSLEASYRFE